MGQYHYIVNLDRGEFIQPHGIGSGLKLAEMANTTSIATALTMLLACSSGRGGGDFSQISDRKKVVGRWAGDRIAIVGDYADDECLAAEHKAGSIYERCGINPEHYDSNDEIPEGKRFTNITTMVRALLELESESVYHDYYMQPLQSIWKGASYSHKPFGSRDRAMKVHGGDVPIPVLIEEARKRLEAGEKPPFVWEDTGTSYGVEIVRREIEP